jgi:hypothetical protein
MLECLRSGKAAALLGTAVLGSIWGCGGGDSGATNAAESPRARDRSSLQSAAEPAAPPTALPAAHCPPGLSGCRTTVGRIVYLERVDPDGDGDAHFVVRDRQGITLRGMTAIDVRKGLRPHPLPGLGEWISAAGPVQTGSYGQSQIHAIELNVAGR